jgi:alpha-amylase
MPVTQSQDRDHGYAVSDYRNIEAQYGSLADFDELLRQAHARGIGIVIDYVINHSAAQHPLFVNAKLASSNPYRDWYLWQGSSPAAGTSTATTPGAAAVGNWYFAPFWDQMPDWNLRNPKVVAFTTTTCASGSTGVSTASASTPWATWSKTAPAPGKTSPRTRPAAATRAR